MAFEGSGGDFFGRFSFRPPKSASGVFEELRSVPPGKGFRVGDLREKRRTRGSKRLMAQRAAGVY